MFTVKHGSVEMGGTKPELLAELVVLISTMLFHADVSMEDLTMAIGLAQKKYDVKEEE